MEQTILDSGSRRTFASGAVRDMGENDSKGRCDLLPLDIIDNWLKRKDYKDEEGTSVPDCINSFLRQGSIGALYQALDQFCFDAGWDRETALLEVSIHYSDGAKKYTERNWEKGIPLHCYLDSCMRHWLKWKRGDIDERHDRAIIWNLLGALYTIKHIPECYDVGDALAPILEEPCLK